jgi:DNA-binding protein WhiA
VLSKEAVEELFEVLKVKDNTFEMNGLLIQQPCCKKAFIRGIFLTSGSVSDPWKDYHFETALSNESLAKSVREVICSFGIDAKMLLSFCTQKALSLRDRIDIAFRL